MDRYQRQRILPFIGDAGQSLLASSHAMIVGVGALGCQLADLLTRAGVGTLTFIDRDIVELTNLQRQTLFTESDAAERCPKVIAAHRRLVQVNSTIKLNPVAADFTSRNAMQLATAGPPLSVILDGSDNFETRYLINDLAVTLGIPYVYGGVIGARSMAMLLRSSPSSPCLRCVFPNPPQPGTQPTCDTAGVLGPAVATAAAWQAALALRALTHQPPDPILHDGDIWNGTWRSIQVRRDADCPCCVHARYELLDAADSESHTFCGSGTIQIWPRRSDQSLDLAALAQRLAAAGTVTATRFMVRASVVEPTVELTVFSDGRALIKGTDDPAVARAAYARYVGS